MRFDDRLMTVLDQPAIDPHDRAVRWRQLVDLVARAGAQAGNPLVDQALDLIRSDRSHVDERLRSAAARAIASLPLPFDLVALFATDSLAVSAPVLAAARLQPDERDQLMGLVDAETRNFIETLHPQGGAEEPRSRATRAPEADRPLMQRQEEPARGTAIPSISDVVARIERLRRSRASHPFPQFEGQATQQVGAPTLFRWECGPSGEIAWVEGAPRGALIGRSIARAEDGEGVDEDVERAFAMRSPFHDGHLSLAGDGVVAGEWKISGVPAFEPTGGRFAGYRGIALREGAAPAASNPGAFVPADPDSLRELVHEIKTPLNAIIGFAEIIDNQYLGPADRGYRTRAAEIVSQARLLLAAIDDLDFAAKLQADRDRPGGGTDLAVLLDQIAAGMRSAAAAGGPQIDVKIATTRSRCALEPALAERLVTRFCDAAIGAVPGVAPLVLHLDNSPGRCLLWVGQTRARSVGADDLSFGLRLVRGLARIAGGDLVMTGRRITLELPEL